MNDKEIETQVRKTLAAYQANDLDTYFGVMAEDATVLIGGKGRASRQIYMGMWSGIVAKGGGVVSAELEDLQVRSAPSGDAGVATFVMNVTYRGLSSDNPDALLDRRIAMTEVWFKTQDRWSMAHMDWFDVPKAV